MEWIKCSERMPPMDGTFVLLAGGETDEDFYRRDDGEGFRPVVAKWVPPYRPGGDDGYWAMCYWDGDWRTGYSNPTHWMPLSEPPKD